MTAASYHSRILIPKYGQTGNVKPLTANRGLPFVVRQQTLILRSLYYVYITSNGKREFVPRA